MRYATLAFSIIALGNMAAAQETTGDIRGRVRNAGNKSVEGVRVIATSPGLQGGRQTLSGTDGVFQVFRLPPATYTITLSAIGFAPVVIDSVRVQLGRTTGLSDVELRPLSVQLQDIRIIAAPLTLDPTRTTIGATLEGRDLSALPSERDYKSLISILPHINTSYHGDPVNAAGSTGLENMYFIDGVNVTTPLSGASGTSLPYNFLRSVEVRTGGYEAQYGKALGAIVNAVTYTGSNHFDSNVFAFFTHDALAAEPRAQPVLRERRFYSYDIGARIGGPIVRDRLWYSAAYNPRIERSEINVGSLGPQQQSSTAHIFAGKLTWHGASGANAEVSVFGDPETARRVFIGDFLASLEPLNRDPYLRRVETGGVTASVRGSVNVSQSVVLETVMTHSRFRDNVLAASSRGLENILADFVEGTLSGGLPFIGKTEERRDAAMVRASASLGRHSPTIGVEYEVNSVAGFFDNPGIGFVGRQDSAIYFVSDGFSDGKVRNRIPTAYIQDSWRIGDRFTLNPGLRWSSQFLIGESGKTAQRFRGEWQPRVGFNWQLGKTRRQRLFGSYGRYYQQEPLNFASTYYIDFTSAFKTYSGNPTLPGAILLDSLNQSTFESAYARQIEHAQVENLDEFGAGYERLLGADGRLTIRALHRELRSTFQQAVDSTGQFVIGSAGHGGLSFLPDPVRRYSAIEAGIESAWRALSYNASYVLSKNYGNFTGLYSTDVFINNPGNNPAFATVHHRKNTTGLLPNDRTHVVKGSGVWRINSSLSAGMSASWMSGTPVSEMGNRDFFPVFLSKRGTAGRTPYVWDVNLRIAHVSSVGRYAGARIVADVLHIGNPRTTVRRDMTHYFATDETGKPTSLNDDYLRATVFQPPMMARIGLEITPRR